MKPLTWTVFVKPWRTDDAKGLARRVADLGFDGIELPVRPGFPVSPENALSELPRWASAFADVGLEIASVAGRPTESLFRACSEADVPYIRIMVPLSAGTVLQDLAAARVRLERCVDLSRSFGVKVAVQQHHGRFVSTSAGLRSLLAGLPADTVGVAWDAGHSALAGEITDIGLGEVQDRLLMVNLKNAVYQAPSDGDAQWAPRWVSGRDGMGDWEAVAVALLGADFSGPICLSAQYSDADDVGPLVRDDLDYARSVFALDSVTGRLGEPPVRLDASTTRRRSLDGAE